MRRVTAVLAIVFGVTLIGFTFAEHLFARSQDAQTIADQYAPLMSAKGLHDLSTGFDAVKATGSELATSAEPRLQQALGMSDAQFKQYVAQQMPGIAKFDAQAPGVVELVGPVIGKMVAVRGDYTKSSEIPVSWLPLTSAPWLSWVSVCSSSGSARRGCGDRAPSRASRCCSSASASQSPRS